MTSVARTPRHGSTPQLDLGVDGVDSRLVFTKLLSRKWMIAACTTVLFGLFSVIVLSIPAWYTSEAEIVIDIRPQGGDLASVLSRLPADSQAVITEAEALRSRPLAEKTIAQLNLLANPEFNPAVSSDDRSIGQQLLRLKSRVAAFLKGLIKGPPRTGSDRSVQNDANDSFLSHLRVSPLGRSQILKATYTSKDPELASKILNTLISLYLQAQIERRLALPETLSAFMRVELDRVQARVRAANEAVEHYRNEAELQQGIVQGRDALLLTQELSGANTELLTVRAKRQDAQSRLNEIRANPTAFAEVLASPTIQQLRRQLSTSRDTLFQLLATYGPGNPKVVQLVASIADIEQRIKGEAAKIASSIASEVAVQTEREADLVRTVGKLREQIQSTGGARVNLAMLEQEAADSRSILTNVQSQYNQLASQRALQLADSYVLTPAEAPTVKSFPDTTSFMAISLAGAFALSCGGALLLERRRETIRSSHEVKTRLATRTLGVIPRLARNHTAVAEVVLEAHSRYTESVRGLFSNLRLVGDGGRVILVTSAQPGEGKTSVAIALSSLAALSGKRVMLIDCDLRRPSVHTALQADMRPGLTDVLQKRADTPDALRCDEMSGLHYLTCGAIGPHSANLLSITGMRTLISELRESYDLVILDSPPSALVSDARILAQIVDQVVFVVSWDKTSWKVAREQIEQLSYDNDHVAGVVLNGVDMRKYPKYYAYTEPARAAKAFVPFE